ncbi:hypothetical protein V8Z80_15290 [Orrella sp. JC864]|uniref:hypothetical protein n=1 Tax=Orrella sp. JC864 TaxID=3120298 RepID=UPI00142BB3F3
MRAQACLGLRQGGQALPLALLVAAAGGLAWLAMSMAGSSAAARSRLTHVADAVAYSGALAQARSLNLLAMINRAQIAHQVGMAHLVTLAAWAQHGQAQSGRVRRGNPPSFLIGMLFGAAYGSAYAAARPGLGGPDGLAQAYARHETVVHDVLDSARRAIVAELPQARMSAMRQVLAANFQAAQPGLLPMADALPAMQLLDENLSGFIVSHAPSGRGSLRGAVDTAVAPYRFLHPRNRTVRNPWSVSRQCPWLRHELRRRGDTRMDLEGRWQAHDTLSYHALRSNRRIGCYFREYPMGWGLAGTQGGTGGLVHHEDPPEDFSAQDFWRWVRAATDWSLLDGSDNFLANSYAVRGAAHWPGRGLPGHADLARSPGGAQSLRLAIRLRLDAVSLRLPGLPASRAGWHGPAAFAAIDAVQADSAAETYFVRPHARADGRAEAPSLFHPYWQARLRPLEQP